MDALIGALLRPEAYDHAVDELQLLETHISWVILTGPFAYKIKKPVNFGFVNFSTLELREECCREELRLNRRLAADLYLDIRPIYGPRAQASFRGAGEPIEFAVRMRQFPQAALLTHVLERNELLPRHLERLADDVAAFHRAAAVASSESPYGAPEAVRQPVLDNLAALERAPQARDSVGPLREWVDARFEELRPLFLSRRERGRVRECHGDMHLGNMLLLDDVVRVFDCLEFNPALRWIDVISEIAFCVMDLQDRGRPDFAVRFLNRWLEQTGDYAGLKTWRWYLAYRALVRAKVAALRLQQGELAPQEQAEREHDLASYLDVARAWTGPRPAAVLILHGLSGSGKSVVAAEVCERLGGVRVRSDVERKRAFGKWGDPGDVRLSGELYTPAATQTIYRDVLVSAAHSILDGGFAAVIDAANLHAWQRRLMIDLAEQRGAPWRILDVTAAPETLRRRLIDRQQRRDEPSDADVAVLELQLAQREPLSADEQRQAVVVDTERADWRERLQADLERDFPELAAASVRPRRQ